MNRPELVRMALDAGASNAEIIEGDKLVASAGFRDLCRSNSCGRYGRSWACPPDVGEIDRLISELGKYGEVLIYQIICQLEDSCDVEGMDEAGKRLSELGQKIQAYCSENIPGPFLHLSGSCRLCETCARISGEPCRFPDRMLPSLSGYGVDVYSTCLNTSMKYINGQNTVTYFGIVLFNDTPTPSSPTRQFPRPSARKPE